MTMFLTGKATKKQTTKLCLQNLGKLYYVEKSKTVDPDETAHYERSHLDLQCLQIQLLLCLALYGLTKFRLYVVTF